jgi:hypothetical protein
VVITAWCLSLLHNAIDRLRTLDPLPVSRRVLFAHVAGPIAITMVAGLLLGSAGLALSERGTSQVYLEGSRLTVPRAYLVLAPARPGAGSEPSAGPSCPEPVPLWRGSSWALVNPWAVGTDSPTGLAALSFRRAVAAIHGPGAVPEVLASTSGVLEARGPREVPDRRLRLAAVTLTSTVWLAAVLVVLAIRRYTNSPLDRLYRWGVQLVVAGFVLAVGALVVADVVGVLQLWVVAALVTKGFDWLARQLPLPTPALWLALASSWVLAYLVVEAQFRALEAPRTPSTKPVVEEF